MKRTNHYPGRGITRRAALLCCAAALLAAWGAPSAPAAGPRAGLGGFRWASATPQSNTLRSVVAPMPGTDGQGLLAVGDASTFLIRRSPLDRTDTGWLCGRGRPVREELSLRGVAALPGKDGFPERVAAVAGDGSVLVGDGCHMESFAVADAALNAAGWSRMATTPRLAVIGEQGAAYYRDGHAGAFQRATITPALPASTDLLALHFPASAAPGVGYAAGRAVSANGAFGLLLKTGDGGRTWAVLPAAPSASAYRDVFFLTADLGFALGLIHGQGIVARTTDGGAKWEVVASVDAAMRAIAAFSPERLVVVGDAGLFASRGAGFFYARPQPVEGQEEPVPLLDVDVAGPEAWAVGAKGVIFRSDDQGETWTPVNRTGVLSDPSLQALHAIQFLSEKHVVAAGARGAFLRSEDGGQTFEPMPGPVESDIFALAAPGARNAGMGTDGGTPGVAVGAGRTVLRFDATLDRWVTRGHLPRVVYRAAAMVNLDQGIRTWAAGDGGVIATRLHGQPLWMALNSGTRANLHALDAVRTEKGLLLVAAGEAGAVLFSRDGANWTPARPLPAPFTNATVRGVFLRTPEVGFLVGDGGLAARTQDGGETWTLLPLNTSADLYAVAASPAGMGDAVYAVGEQQTVARSPNNGAAWEVLPPPVGGTVPQNFILRAVQVVGADHVFIAGDQGHLLEKVPGVGAWLERGDDGSNLYFALRMADARTGMAVLYHKELGPRVAFTEDGWRSSRYAPLPPGTPVLYGGDLLGDRSVVVGAQGAALGASDARAQEPRYQPESAAIRAVVSPAPGEYIAAGEGALLLHSRDDGLTWEDIPLRNPYGPDVEFRALGFFPPNGGMGGVGFLAGKIPGKSEPVLFRTDDGGKSWQAAPPDVGSEAAGIHALAVFSGMVLAGAENGAVYLFDGARWNVHRPIPGFQGAWNAISATDARWYVVGDQGRAARWPDAKGAPAWLALNTGTRHAMRGISGPTPETRLLAGGGGGDSLRDDIRGVTLDPSGVIFTDTGGLALFGDVNRDTLVNVVDERSVLMTGAGQALPSEDVLFFGDLFPPAPDNESLPGDGVVNLGDSIQLWRAVMGL